MITAEQTGNATTGVGALTTLVAWATSNQGLGVLGVLIAFGGLLVTWHYKHQSNLRQKELHVLRVQRLKRGMPDIDPDDDSDDE